jgi:hypothetical protein
MTLCSLSQAIPLILINWQVTGPIISYSKRAYKVYAVKQNTICIGRNIKDKNI